jgi:hypothetical protein
LVGAQRRLSLQPLKERYEICRRFPRSGLCLAGYVLSVERQRQRFALDGSALCKAGLRDAPLQLGRQREVDKLQIG